MDTPKLLKALVQSSLIQQNWISKENLETLLKSSPKKPLAELLITKGILSKNDFQKIVYDAKQKVGQMRARSAKTPEMLTPLEDLETIDSFAPTVPSIPVVSHSPQDLTEEWVDKTQIVPKPVSSPKKGKLESGQPTLNWSVLQDIENDSLAKTVSIPKNDYPQPAKTVPMLPVKKRFGQYEVLEKLAQGAMGIVFKVRHIELKQICALKVIISGEHASEEAIQRFYQEAKTAAKIKHPNIIQILDMGQEGSEHFFVMEYVEGKTLEQCIEDGLSVKEGVQLLKKSLDALHSAHQQGIIHRDLKPSNIFVTAKKEPKIGDFGLAKDLSRDSRSQQLTQSGVILGTPAYMPPEQAMGETSKLDARTDIYAMGVCLYQILTARLPFEGSTLHELFYKLVNDEVVPPSKWNSSVAKDLDTITLKALEKVRTKRYQSAKMFALDLDRFLRGYPIQARAVSSVERLLKWARRNRMLVSATVVLIFSLGSFYGYTRWSAYQTRQNHLQELFQKADGYQEEAKQAIKEQRQTRQYSALLNSLKVLNTLLAIDSKHQGALVQKVAICQELIDLACSNQEYEFALYLASEIEGLSHSKKDFKASIEAQKNKISKQNEAEFKEWIDKLKSNMLEFGEREDAVYEISRMSEPQIFQDLLNYLEEGSRYFTEESTSEAQLEAFYTTVVQIIGRLGNVEASKPLLQALEKMASKTLSYREKIPYAELNYIAHLTQALGNIKSVEALPILNQLQFKFGEAHAVTLLLQKAYQKINLAKNTVESLSLKTNIYNRGQEYFIEKNWEEALRCFEEVLRTHPHHIEAYFFRGRIRQIQQSWKLALDDYNKTIQLNPNVAMLYNQRAQVREVLNDIHGAIDDYNEAIRLETSYFQAYLNRGKLKFNLQKFPEALLDYNQAIRINPLIPEAYFNRGSVKRLLTQYQEALQDFEEAIRLNPQYAEAYNNRGQMYMLLQKYEEALNDYNKSLQLDSKFPPTYFNRGILKEKTFDFSGALDDFRMALQLDSEYAIAYAHCGICLEHLGQIQEAERAYEKAIRLKPSLAKSIQEIRKKK